MKRTDEHPVGEGTFYAGYFERGGEEVLLGGSKHVVQVDA